MQHRLHLLLLPVQGGAVPEREAPHVRGHARGLHPPAAGVAPHAAGHGGLAGRRAHADEARVLPPRGGAGRQAPACGADRAAHLPDQRTAARRRLVRVLQAARLPRGLERRRPARAARRLSRRPPRPGHLRSGDARLALPAQTRGRLQHPVHGERRQPAARPHRLSLLPRRAGCQVGAVHPHHRARHRADHHHRQQGLERAARQEAAALHPDRKPGHRAHGRRRTVRPFPDRHLRGMGAPRRRTGVRAAVRRHAGGLLRPPPVVHPRPHLRLRPGAGAQRRPVRLRPLRRAEVQARQHPPDAHDRAGGFARAAQVRPGQARHAHGPVPWLQGPQLVQWRLPEGPLRAVARRRAGPELPVRGPGAVLHPHRADLQRHGATAAAEPPAGGRDGVDRRQDAKRGAYQPCPCGSGRKFRFCHGDKAPSSPFSGVDRTTQSGDTAPPR